MIRSVVISIPRTRSSPDDLDIRALWLANALATEQVIAKVGYAVTPLRSRFEIAGVLAYYDPSWDVLESTPCRRAVRSAGIDPGEIALVISRAAGFSAEEYCGPRLKGGSFVLVCDPINGLPPLRLAGTHEYVAAHRLRLKRDTLMRLWVWDEAYRHTYGLWMSAGPHESWASKELSRRTSKLNTAGFEVARLIMRDTGRPVEVYVHDGV